MEPMQRRLLFCLAWCYSDDFVDAVTMLCVIVTFLVCQHCSCFVFFVFLKGWLSDVDEAVVV